MKTTSDAPRLPGWISRLASEDAYVISVELLLVATVAIIGLMVGYTSIRDAAIAELSDLSGAVQDINQHYTFNGLVGHSGESHGSGFSDSLDWCDSANDAPGSIDNCVTFSGPMDEDGGGDDGGDPGSDRG